MKKLPLICLASTLSILTLPAFSSTSLTCPIGQTLTSVKFSEADLDNKGIYTVTGIAQSQTHWAFIASGQAKSQQDAIDQAENSLSTLVFEKLEGFHCLYKSSTEFNIFAVYID